MFRILLLALLCVQISFAQKTRTEKRILIFSKNAAWAYRHASIEFGAKKVKEYCEQRGINADISEDASQFNDENLQKYSSLVFLSANQDIFDADQEAALQRYIRSGGGFVGIHSSSGVERNWKWFNQMLGATFKVHPPYQDGTVKVIDKKHPSTKMLPNEWKRTDEWYFFTPMTNKLNVLMVLDSTTFKSNVHTQNYPNAWYHDFEGGRSFYTAGGHSEKDFEDPLFMQHIFGGISYAIGKNKMLDYSKNAKFEKAPARIITLDPGHFHAALVQKTMLAGLNSEVQIYAPAGEDLNQHLQRINSYNTRKEAPTSWKTSTYTGSDYFEKMISEKKGDIVVMAGNNATKTDAILKSVESGMNVLADKPMCINTEGYEKLKTAFKVAKEKNILLYDIMTERSEITTTLQRELSMMKGIFGDLLPGTPEDPSIIKESVHHFFKYVSGSPLIRPQWFMDTKQQGEGIVDVTTHLVDLALWAAFPETPLDVKDAHILAAKRWPTEMTLEEFGKITGAKTFPDFLKKDLKDANTLNVFANGEIDFKVKNVHSKVKVLWNYSTDKGGDTHYSIIKGSLGNIEIKQGEEEKYMPTLYIKNSKISEANLNAEFEKLKAKYPGISLVKTGTDYIVDIPTKYRTGHEAHFGEVMERYLKFYKVKNLPDWEVPNMLLKYYITTSALELANKQK
ncbi:MAG: putative oxidoreductase C-terminal domain-containing protein [Leadbetterella sp.]|nr:putative oxidoreductase C-terminal domain-containing protein [Leadbetterella sp.]